jgi:hypothetical protein
MKRATRREMLENCIVRGGLVAAVPMFWQTGGPQCPHADAIGSAVSVFPAARFGQTHMGRSLVG